MENRVMKIKRMKELVEKLNHASYLYYAKDIEEISNFEYDQLYDELLQLEDGIGVILTGSPTQKVGYEAVLELEKEKHEKPMLSLTKTKERNELISWIVDQEALLSWKLDGITIVLTYENGILSKAVTRGNGEEGEVVTNNAMTFQNIPFKIPFGGKLVIRGEAVIHYSDFEKMNDQIEEIQLKYKNPRNLCSGSVRQLNNEITASRKVNFYAFSLVTCEGKEELSTREEQLNFLVSLGIQVVEFKVVQATNLLEAIEQFAKKIEVFDIPSDGLVLLFNEIEYGQSLGMTAKFPRDSIAFKWEDEIKETRLLEVEWSPSRTGLINPVAIFEPVELEGTTVSRASVHNISVMKSLKLGLNDTIKVYKANMIIPQIAENLTKSNTIELPSLCPVCGGPTEIKSTLEVQSLYCMNEECEVKKVKAFSLFVSRDALNIDGLSEATLEKLIAKGFVHEFADLFFLSQYKEDIVQMDGFGIKSYEKLVQNIAFAQNTTMARLVYALGIDNIGVANAKMLSKYFDYHFASLQNATAEELSQIDGIGEVIAQSIEHYFSLDKNKVTLERLLTCLTLEKPKQSEHSGRLEGKTFVITGTLETYKSRNDLKNEIEEKGGKVVGAVTKKIECLINNDNFSTSSKNKKAKELDVKILTEKEFIEHYL